MKLTEYGTWQLIGGTALLVALAALGLWAFWPLAVLPLTLWVWLVAFFRDPDRTPPEGEHLMVSPADGRVTDITPLGDECVLGREAMQIGVFMSLFNVHVNRAPASGTIERIDRRGGAYLDARDPAAGEKNASATIALSVGDGEEVFRIVFRQIAGMVARRIVTDLVGGQDVRRGQRIGMIRFGSRCELIVPTERVGEVLVRPGQRVRAGATALVALKGETGDDSHG